MVGIWMPGFMARAFLIQALRCRVSLGNKPPPKVRRLPTCVRSGPVVARIVGTPFTV